MNKGQNPVNIVALIKCFNKTHICDYLPKVSSPYVIINNTYNEKRVTKTFINMSVMFSQPSAHTAIHT